jgi:hypothetical protein
MLGRHCAILSVSPYVDDYEPRTGRKWYATQADGHTADLSPYAMFTASDPRAARSGHVDEIEPWIDVASGLKLMASRQDRGEYGLNEDQT